jgi:hypothetical protein
LLYSVLSFALDGVGGEHHDTDAIFSGESTNTHFIRDSVGIMAGLDGNMEEKISLIPSESEPLLVCSVSVYRLHYPDPSHRVIVLINHHEFRIMIKEDLEQRVNMMLVRAVASTC